MEFLLINQIHSFKSNSFSIPSNKSFFGFAPALIAFLNCLSQLDNRNLDLIFPFADLIVKITPLEFPIRRNLEVTVDFKRA